MKKKIAKILSWTLYICACVLGAMVSSFESDTFFHDMCITFAIIMSNIAGQSLYWEYKSSDKNKKTTSIIENNNKG